jgi:hypothetical protein
MQAQHMERMAEARGRLDKMRRRDKEERQRGEQMLTRDEHTVAREIVEEAEANRKVGAPSAIRYPSALPCLQ